MSYTLTFAGASMPLPAQERGIETEYAPIGVSGRTAAGEHRVQRVALKWRVRFTWVGLTTTERSALLAVYVTNMITSMAVVLPDGLSFIGYVDFGSWAESPWYDPFENRTLYNVTFAVVEE